MWILMKQKFQHGLSQFIGGQKYDLNAEILSHIPKNRYEKTCPPWEEHTDKDAAALDGLRQNYLKLQGRANRLTDVANSATEKSKQFLSEVDAKKIACEKIKAELEKAAKASEAATEKAKKSTATEGDKKRAKKLSRTLQTLIAQDHRLSSELMKAEGLLQAAIADESLTAIDANDAKAAADAAYDEVEKLALKIANKTAKAKTKVTEADNGKIETGETGDEPSAADGKNAADTGGQAAKAGEDAAPVPDKVK